MSAVEVRVAVALGMIASALSCQLLLEANANPVALPLHVWLPFEVIMSPSTFVVRVDGVPTILSLVAVGPVEGVTVSLGLTHDEDQGWTARYDDVRCTY